MKTSLAVWGFCRNSTNYLELAQYSEIFSVGPIDSLRGSEPVPHALPLSIVHDFVRLPPSSSGAISVAQSAASMSLDASIEYQVSKGWRDKEGKEW